MDFLFGFGWKLKRSFERDSGKAEDEIIEDLQTKKIEDLNFNPLELAVRNGRFQCVLFLLKNYPELIDQECHYAGKPATVAHVALFGAYLEILCLLIRNRFSFLLPVLESARRFHFSSEIVEFLENLKVENLLEIKVEDLHKNHKDRIQLQKFCSSMNSAYSPNLNELKGIAVERIANFRDENDSSLLHKAVVNNHIDIVKWLLENTPILDSYDYTGDTAAFYAVEDKNMEILELLHRKFPNLGKQRDNFGTGITLLESSKKRLQEGELEERFVSLLAKFVETEEGSGLKSSHFETKEYVHLYRRAADKIFHQKDCFYKLYQKARYGISSLPKDELVKIRRKDLCPNCFPSSNKKDETEPVQRKQSVKANNDVQRHEEEKETVDENNSDDEDREQKLVRKRFKRDKQIS